MGNALLMLAVIAVMTSVLLYKFHFCKKHTFLLLGSPRLMIQDQYISGYKYRNLSRGVARKKF